MKDICIKDKSVFFTELAEKLRLDRDTLLGMYLSVGDNLFLFLSLLEGRTLTFPALSRFKGFVQKIPEKVKVLELPEDNVENIYKEDVILFDTKLYKVCSEVVTILDRHYILVSDYSKENKNGD